MDLFLFVLLYYPLLFIITFCSDFFFILCLHPTPSSIPTLLKQITNVKSIASRRPPLPSSNPPAPPSAWTGSTHHPGPPHASHVPLRQGARHWAPPSLSSLQPPPPPVFRPCTPLSSIISAPLASIASSQRPLGQKKRKGRIKKKAEKNTAATMQNSAGRSTVFCPGPCLSSPGLPCKHTLFSEETTAWRLGGWKWGVVLSKAV